MKILNFAVIGHPIGHTMSPFIQSRLFSLSGVNARYGAIDVAPENLKDFLSRPGGWDGFNFTIPHKRAIIPFLDSLDQKARMTGSVNTVKIEAGKLSGFTTDGDGFRLSLRAAGFPLKGRAVILGAGGAASALAFEAALAGCRVTVAAREHSFPSAAELCADLNRKVPGAGARACLIGEIDGTMDLLVNATPAGMFPNVTSCAADEALVRRAGCVFDAVYNPQETALIRLAKKNGIPAVGGMAMLVWQAAAAQAVWTGARFRPDEIARLCGDAALEMKKKFGNIVLCGFMGCGKTTVGKLVAGRTGRRFVDMDQWIEEKEGCPIARIFAELGENRFRQLEREAARELSMQTGLVVATGGGALMDRENAREFKTGGIVILLDASLDAVRSRLQNDGTRPLLRSGGAALERLFQERLPVYREHAELNVPADGPPEQTAELVLKALEPNCGFQTV